MRISVPPQVCSTSSGWAAIARMSSGFSTPADARSTSWNISLPLRILWTALARGHQQNQTHPRQESADVREPGHVATGSLRIPNGTHAAEKLDRKPVQKQKRGRDVHGCDENNDRHQSHYPCARKLDQVSAHHSGDGAACAHGGHGGRSIHQDVDDTGCESARQVEEEKLCVSENVLDSAPENPQKPHVPQNVQKSAVDEH